MPNCCVPGCKNSSENGYLLRSFPKNEVLRAQWVKNINKPGFSPNHFHRICEVHFTPNMWEKTRVDGTRKLKHNAMPIVFKDRVNEELAPTDVMIPQVDISEENEDGIKKNETAVVKILPPVNSKNAKPIILPASIFKNQINIPSTIIVDTEGKIINAQPVNLVPKTTNILRPQIKSVPVSSAPMIISTNASSSILRNQIKSASNQSPIVIPASGSILKPQFTISAQKVSNQQPHIIQQKGTKSILIPQTNSYVKKLGTPKAITHSTPDSVQNVSNFREIIEIDSELMSAEEFSDSDISPDPLGSTVNRTKVKKPTEDRFEKMDKLLLKQLRLNNALRKKLTAANHQLHLIAKEKTGNFKEYLKDIFTEDQMRTIELRHINPKSVTAWSHKTMIKAIKLKECCGTRGYEELLRQNMPLPSIRTISRWCTQRNIPIP